MSIRIYLPFIHARYVLLHLPSSIHASHCKCIIKTYKDISPRHPSPLIRVQFIPFLYQEFYPLVLTLEIQWKGKKMLSTEDFRTVLSTKLLRLTKYVAGMSSWMMWMAVASVIEQSHWLTGVIATELDSPSHNKITVSWYHCIYVANTGWELILRRETHLWFQERKNQFRRVTFWLTEFLPSFERIQFLF